jgi:hypothetical protein
MTYTELEDELLFFDKMNKDFEKAKRGTTEYEQEQAGFISGGLYEAHEMLDYALSNSKENFESITKFLEKHCPNTFSLMIANLDSNKDKYETLYDLLVEINTVVEDNFYFPSDCIKRIKIYY